MDAKKLEILMTAVDLGSFSKASEVVGYTQSGLTHLVDSLEREIGFPLIRRSYSGIALTEAGENLLPDIRQFLQANATLENKIQAVREQQEESIRVAAYASIAMYWMPEILYRFRRLCPKVDVDLRMVDHALEPFELLQSGKTDVIFASRQKEPKCEWIPLYHELLYAILPKQYPLNGRKEFPLREFEGKDYKISKNKTRDIIFTTLLYLIIIFVFVVIGSFVYYAFIDNFIINKSFSLKHFEYVLSNDIGKYILNSLLIAVSVAVIGTFITYFTAYATARIKGKIAKLIHILTISSLAIPGIVLGLSYTIGFKDTFIYNTFIIMIIVNIIHFMASPYLMAYNALLKINPNYEVVAKTCNISSFRIIKDVIIPCSKITIREMIAYFFINSMVTISAVTFLFNTDTMPLSLMINTYEGNMMLGEAAIVSLIILFFNLIVKGTIYIINMMLL